MKYFVLFPRSAKAGDPYAKASRAAMLAYAKAIKKENPVLSHELTVWAEKEDCAEMALEKLKPCPFCGGKCCVCEISGNINKELQVWRAHCQDCDCSLSTDKNNYGFNTKAEIAEVWNTRYGEGEE